MLTFGLIGGGSISHNHILGATANGQALLRCGCFSRDAERNAAFARQYDVDAKRAYPNFETMIDQEAGRSDRPDFVVVSTPNDSHYDICRALLLRDFPVACDKPLAVTAWQADELARLSRDRSLPCCVTYTPTGLPFVHLMRALLQEGMIGTPYYAALTFYHGSRLAQVMDGNIPWRFQKSVSGEAGSLGDICSHLEYLLRFITGRDLEQVLARLIYKPGAVELDTSGSVLFQASGGLEGVMSYAQLSCGHTQDIRVELMGDAGTLYWQMSQPDQLRVERLDGRTEILRQPGLVHPVLSQFSSPRYLGGNAALGFVNIYDSFIKTLTGRRDSHTPPFPGFADGAKGVQFIEACLQSHRQDSAWVTIPKNG